METEKLMLIEKDLELLTKHLKASNLSEYNKQKLLEELESAIVVAEYDLPADTICLESEVEIREAGGGRSFTFQIVVPAEANMQKGKVSVLRQSVSLC